MSPQSQSQSQSRNQVPRPTRRIPLYNGALECRLYGFRLVRGTLRGDVRPEAGGETRASGAGAPGGAG